MAMKPCRRQYLSIRKGKEKKKDGETIANGGIVFPPLNIPYLGHIPRPPVDA